MYTSFSTQPLQTFPEFPSPTWQSPQFSPWSLAPVVVYSANLSSLILPQSLSSILEWEGQMVLRPWLPAHPQMSLTNHKQCASFLLRPDVTSERVLSVTDNGCPRCDSGWHGDKAALVIIPALVTALWVLGEHTLHTPVLEPLVILTAPYVPRPPGDPGLLFKTWLHNHHLWEAVPNSSNCMNHRAKCVDQHSSKIAGGLRTQILETGSRDANPSSATQQLCDLEQATQPLYTSISSSAKLR